MNTFWPFATRRSAKIDALIKAYARLGRFSGAVLVARGDRVLLKRGYGLASYEHRVPNTPQTAFRIGSQTKAFTAIAILQLQEGGKLAVHDPIGGYLPGYPHGDQISIHHLLTNTAGIPDYITAEGFSQTMGLPHTPDELIASFKDRPLLFQPGAGFSYSNSGWVLLGAIIERVSGQPYADYLRERILAPAGMHSSGYARQTDSIAGHAGGYVYQDDQVVHAAYIDNSTQYAAGGLHASAEDLYRWDRALYTDQLLSRASRELLWARHAQAEEGSFGYGVVVRDAFGHRAVESSGGTFGFVTVTVRYPDDDLVIIVLSNFENGAYSQIERDLAAIVFGQPYELPSARVFVSVSPAIFDAYVGRYETVYIGRRHIMDVTREQERLMVQVRGLAKTELRPMSETRFFARMKGEVELNFVPNGGAAPQEIEMNWLGHAMTARRVSG
jgi:CubicO group peptidase (beta-lactamase class C family)